MRCITFAGSLLLSTASTALADSALSDILPLLGPSFLSNFNPADSHAIGNATEVFSDKIDALFESQALNSTDLVFAIDIFSAATNTSIFQYHHVGEGQEVTLSAGTLNDQTISRTGSVTKLFTVYALLAKAGIDVFSHPVTEYIPELVSNISESYTEHIRWEDITVGALASHQAGSGGAGALLQEHLEDVTAITPDDLIAHMRDVKRPVISPYRNAVYSDGGFAILGEVLARLCGKSYGDAIQDVLFKPLEIENMSVTAPKGEGTNAINRTIVSELSTFNVDAPIVAGSGGIFANGADIRTAGLSILNSALLSPATTRQWMKPMSGTGSLVELVGAPWEIHRLAIPTTPHSNRTRVSDLYTKAGGNGDYTCIFALSPDHGIGFSILVAGSTASSARWPLRDAVGELFIPAAEAAAAANAKINLAGTFVDAESEGTNITLSVDDDLPGIGVQSLYINDTESSSVLVNPAAEAKPIDASLRLYPTGLNSYSPSLASLYRTHGTMEVSHRLLRIQRPFKPRASSEGGDGGLFDNQPYWMTVDFQDNIDEFVFTLVDGRLMSVENVGSKLKFERVE